ncbi:MAG: hypothetical protein O3C40_32465 [Planctomycetota bacterium]|nr:hypothetical protein [Planctomycetota bacterium]
MTSNFLLTDGGFTEADLKVPKAVREVVEQFLTYGCSRVCRAVKSLDREHP